MILIDTSAWIEFLRPKGRRDVKEKVALLIESDRAAITGPVVFELLAGADKKTERDVREVMAFCRKLPFQEGLWGEAAFHERRLRQRGIVIPRDDLFIATVAIANDIPLLHADRHFDLAVEGGLPLQAACLDVTNALAG